ncbi:MAG: alpha/beta hydrolase [Pseudomonadota bacterium]
MTLQSYKNYSHLRLNDGRRLSFVEGGAQDGFPVFYFHGTPSSRLEATFADTAATQRGFRLIATDRPGFGQSDFQYDRTLQSWPADVLALADFLQIGAFGIAGHSGGGAYLFACGTSIDPSRLRFIGALAPWGPVASPEIMASLNRLDRAFATLARSVPWIMSLGFAPMGWAATRRPELFLRLLKGAVSPPDQRVLDRPDVARVFSAMEKEAFRQGSRGPALDAYLAYSDWGFDIASNRIPIHMWLGDEDIFVPKDMGQYIARTVPQMNAHWITSAGHLCFDAWDDIFAACRSEMS